MDSNEKNNIIKSLVKSIGEYIETKIDLLKLKTIEKSVSILSSLFSCLIILIVFFVFIIVLSIGLAIWIGEILGKLYYGFFIIAALYAITGVLFYCFRKSFIKNPFSNMFIKKILK